MTEFHKKKQITDVLGSPIPQHFNEELGVFVANTNGTGDASDVDFSKLLLLRDNLYSPIPQYYDVQEGEFKALTSEGSGGGSTPEFVDATKIVETDEKQLISKVEKDQIELNKTALLQKVDASQVGVPEGVARLNTQGKVIDANGDEVEGTVDSILATKIIETPDKVLVTSSQRSQIDANATEISSHSQRLSDLQLEINNSVSTDEKVKMDASGVASYLSELIDGLTIKDINGKLTVEGLSGLLSSINELNFLQGTSSNIQQQINNLSGVSSFRGVFTSLEDLELAPSPQAGEYAIVSDGTTSDYYFYYGNAWDYSHATTSATSIDLVTNTTGTLPKSRYEKQNALETPFTDPNGKVIATDTNTAILEVFRFADSLLKGLTQTVGYPLSSTDTIDVSLQKFKQWWAGLANAITNKGISTSTSNNGNDMIQKIGAIPNISVSGGIKRIDKLNAIAPYNLDIVLDQPLKLEDICVTLFEYVKGTTGVVKYDVKFNNGDKTDFEDNKFVKFDGVASLQKEYKPNLEVVNDWYGFGIIEKILIKKDDFESIERVYLI